MARLTILQASQQGFGSTLTIHRHIKDGTLPVYEEGDTKLLDVDDLISVFGEPGEPGGAAGDRVAPAANGQIDIHEFNRIKAELDQKNKKNMWLAADLAEVVRELKEKEASFEKERNRLLTVLEQAQALLLREAGKDGELKTALDQTGDATAVADAMGAFDASTDQQPIDTGIETGAAIATGDQPDLETPAAPIDNPVAQSLEGLLPKLEASPADAGIPEPSDDNVIGAEAGIDHTIESNIDVPEPDQTGMQTEQNPLMPPLDDPNASLKKTRSIGVTTWVLLIAMIGGGFLAFEYRAHVIAGLSKLGKIVSGY
jgi:hypothetical protein